MDSVDSVDGLDVLSWGWDAALVLLGSAALLSLHRLLSRAHELSRRLGRSAQPRCLPLRLPPALRTSLLCFLAPQDLARLALTCSALRTAAEEAAKSILLSLPRSVLDPAAAAAWRPDRPHLVRLLHEACSERVYLLGGSGGLRTAHLLCPASMTLTELSPMLRPREHFTAVAFRGHIFAISSCGDIRVGKHGGSSSAGTVERYNPLTDRWTEVAPLPRPLVAVAAAVFGDHLYVIGGYDCVTGDYSRTVFRYTPGAGPLGGWKAMRTLCSVGRAGASAIEFEGRLFLAGGVLEGGGCTSSVEAFDPALGQWSLAPPMRLPRGFFRLACVGRRLCAVGSDAGGLVEVLDSSGLFWKQSAFVQAYQTGCSAAGLGSRLLVFGLKGAAEDDGWDCFFARRRVWVSATAGILRLPRGFSGGQAVAVGAAHW